MIDVNDVIANLEITQVRQERLRRRSAAIRRATFFFEDIGFGIDLKIGVGKPESLRHRALCDQNGRVPGVFGSLDRNGEDVVFLQQLDRSFGAARRRRGKERRATRFTVPPNVRHPVRQPSMKRHCRLAT